jgi:hypothetical protein
MERDLDYSADDPWKYQFTKYPNPDDPEAYKHDEGQKCAVLDIIAASANAAQGDAPFSKGSGEALKRITANAVFGEYKTDSSGEVKGAFDDMRAAWGHCLDRTARAFPPAAELAVEAREAQDEFFDAWYDLANVFRYPDFGAYHGYEHFMCIRHFGAYAALADKLRVRLKAIQAAPPAAERTANAAERTAAAAEWLVAWRKEKKQKNKENGTANQAKGNTEERKRAARDMKTALDRVHDRLNHGATNLLAECRAVCRTFKPWTNRKNALGAFVDCEPLTRADGEAVKPETLAKNYRARYGTKKARKARAAKAKRRTK